MLQKANNMKKNSWRLNDMINKHHTWFFNWCKENHPEIIKEFMEHAKEAVSEVRQLVERTEKTARIAPNRGIAPNSEESGPFNPYPEASETRQH